MTSPAPPPGPLRGLKVLEMGALIAGPFCAKILAEFGADVVKLEPPGHGDPLRKWRYLKDGTSVWWHVQSRNKRSVSVDLRAAEGQAIARALAERADIVVENFRPGTLEAWGLDYAALAVKNPGLIMVRISGYGQTGPYRGASGLRRHRRSDGWAAPRHRHAGPAAVARGQFRSATRCPRCTASSARCSRSSTGARPASGRSSTWRCTSRCSR